MNVKHRKIQGKALCKCGAKIFLVGSTWKCEMRDIPPMDEITSVDDDAV